jgi:hypothetical protein
MNRIGAEVIEKDERGRHRRIAALLTTSHPGTVPPGTAVQKKRSSIWPVRER